MWLGRKTPDFANSDTDVLAGSYNGPGQPETFSYSNPYATDFVYFVKVKAKTDGTFTLSSE